MNLWASPAVVARVRAFVAANEPTASAIAGLALVRADATPAEDETQTFLVACAVTHLLTGERRYADRAHAGMLAWTTNWSRGELGRGVQSLIGAVVTDCCYEAWDDGQRRTMRELLVRLHESFRVIHPGAGDPHVVTNNHWAVAHAGAALAAMTAHGRDGVDLTEGIAWARGRTRVFLHHFGDDAILGCYARTTHVGGHAHDDAGSVRFMALGHDWIMGGGQARTEAQYQSIVTPSDDSRTKPFGLGAVIWDTPTVFGMGLRRPSVGYAERYVAVDFGDASTRLALLDVLDDHAHRDWVWNLTFDPGLRCETFAGGFRLLAADDANLIAHFLGPQPVDVRLHVAPDSSRTYQNGNTPRYPGRPTLSARFRHAPHLGVYVVMSVQRGEAPSLRLLEGLDVEIAGRAWRRPFGAVIPAAFRLGTSGTLCRWPSGTVSS